MSFTERTRTRTKAEPFGDTWLKETWRPAMALVYMFICLYDFVVADILRLYLMSGGIVDPAIITAWTAQTLTNGGVFHFSMGVILGATAWTRGQEKIRRIDSYNDPFNSPFSDPFFNASNNTVLSQNDIMSDPSVRHNTNNNNYES